MSGNKSAPPSSYQRYVAVDDMSQFGSLEDRWKYLDMIKKENDRIAVSSTQEMERPPSPYDKLKARLDMTSRQSFGLDFLHVFEGSSSTFVFIVQNDKAIVLEDPKGLFPSDKIVMQVRLMQDQT